MTSEIPNDVPYLSAPTSPSRCSSDAMLFYSAPTSPISAYNNKSQPQTPKCNYEDANSNLEEFEFELETSCHFDHLGDVDFEKTQKNLESPLAFADQLFCNGKVLPLKLPPRLQTSKFGLQSPTASSPRSPSSVLKILGHRSLWNDDFDPFLAAMENVKDDKKSPRKPNDLEVGPVQEPNGPLCSVWIPNQNKPTGQNPKRLAEPKGVEFARRVRMVKLGQDRPKSENVETTRQKIKKFLLRSASTVEGGNYSEEKPKGVWNMWKLSFKSRGSSKCGENRSRRVSEVANMTLVQYRPKLLLCLGYGVN